ncbi:MAG: peptide chain release factor N(5)-glutamine methyltransferase [Chitinophagaceae bacterium]|nr:MAG: peptide chain release factor N(5)-glutamine methyltransferase [Chitinophagaceae bacterium]
MITISLAFHRIRKELSVICSASESAAVAHVLLEHITGYDRAARLTRGDDVLNAAQTKALEGALVRLLTGEPIQYITGEQWFMGRPFYVTSDVLIPRPETEELVQWVLSEWKQRNNISILDIGTGSGCIPITLQLSMPGSQVFSLDVSEKALLVAAQNASRQEANVNFVCGDFLDGQVKERLGMHDVIISNPPYIPYSDKDLLDKNVGAFEPGVALFVPDDDPLLFYRHIASFSQTQLKDGGAVYCELNQDLAQATADLFEGLGFIATMKQDIFGNDRMLRASKK